MLDKFQCWRRLLKQANVVAGLNAIIFHIASFALGYDSNTDILGNIIKLTLENFGSVATIYVLFFISTLIVIVRSEDELTLIQKAWIYSASILQLFSLFVVSSLGGGLVGIYLVGSWILIFISAVIFRAVSIVLGFLIGKYRALRKGSSIEL